MRRLEELLRQMCQAAKAIGNTELENKFADGGLLWWYRCYVFYRFLSAAFEFCSCFTPVHPSLLVKRELNPKTDFSSFELLGIVEQLYEVFLSC